MLQHIELLESRKNLYRFLGRLYRREVDEAFLAKMKALTFPEDCDVPEIAEGYRLIGNYLRTPQEDAVTDLAVDYAHSLLGAGIAEGIVAYPIESVYTSPDHLIMQEAYEKVHVLFQKECSLHSDSDIPEDHLGLELEFMAIAIDRTIEGLKADDAAKVEHNQNLQKTFLKEHLCNWVPACMKDLSACALTDFYRGLAKLTCGFIKMEEELLLPSEEEVA
jgi:anaerobic sulfite reductase subunit A